MASHPAAVAARLQVDYLDKKKGDRRNHHRDPRTPSRPPLPSDKRTPIPTLHQQRSMHVAWKSELGNSEA